MVNLTLKVVPCPAMYLPQKMVPCPVVNLPLSLYSKAVRLNKNSGHMTSVSDFLPMSANVIYS